MNLHLKLIGGTGDASTLGDLRLAEERHQVRVGPKPLPIQVILEECGRFRFAHFACISNVGGQRKRATRAPDPLYCFVRHLASTLKESREYEDRYCRSATPLAASSGEAG